MSARAALHDQQIALGARGVELGSIEQGHGSLSSVSEYGKGQGKSESSDGVNE